MLLNLAYTFPEHCAHDLWRRLYNSPPPNMTDAFAELCTMCHIVTFLCVAEQRRQRARWIRALRSLHGIEQNNNLCHLLMSLLFIAAILRKNVAVKKSQGALRQLWNWLPLLPILVFASLWNAIFMSFTQFLDQSFQIYLVEMFSSQ